METIDVSDLPEPFAQAVKAVADIFRRQLAGQKEKDAGPEKASPVKLSVCDGAVIGSLSREEIYDDRT